jgi:hypothetical protein
VAAGAVWAESETSAAGTRAAKASKRRLIREPPLYGDDRTFE